MSDEILYHQVYELTKIIEEMQKNQNRLVEATNKMSEVIYSLQKEVSELRYISRGERGGIKDQVMSKIIDDLRKLGRPI